MPLINIDVLETHLNNGTIRIYTIDTSIFCQYQFNFNTYPLDSILNDYGNIEFKLSSFIYNEILKKYREHTKNNYEEIKRKLRKVFSIKQFKVTYDSIEKIDTDKECKRVMDNFFNPLKKHLFSIRNYIDAIKISNMYFNTHPPFENKENKKYEFPDALALNVLENYANRHDINILVLSNDKGWNNFCETSTVLYGIKKEGKIKDNNILKECLTRFDYSNIPNELITKIKDIIYNNEIIRDTISDKIEHYLDDTSIIEPIIDCAYQYEEEIDGIDITNIDFDNFDVNITHLKYNEYCIYTSFIVSIDCHATFDILIWDSEDKEYLKIDSKDMTAEAEIIVDINISAKITDKNYITEDNFLDFVIKPHNIMIDFGAI